jgi:hypothetical protein
LLKV